MIIDANLVKELREKTGAGILDCRKALVEANGDLEMAVDVLRKRGVAIAAKKIGRLAADGLAAAYVDGNVGIAIEVNAETDFVAKNTEFQNLVSKLSRLAIKYDTVERLNSAEIEGVVVQDLIVASIAKIGENISIRRIAKVMVNNGVVASYVHNAVVANMGKIVVLVALESSVVNDKLSVLGKQLAMHIAANKPVSLDIAGVDAALIEREKAIFIEQSKSSGKPDNIIEKMVEGRIRKFYEEVALLEQVFVMDNKTKIRDVLAAYGTENGCKVEIKAFVRYEVGYGIEAQQTNFADEVAKMVS